ncbi:MAG: hypothetical protein IH984_11800 [Planctomycetes bacterium]|nr:hypothetical protein [Planctomycetota bacterium]
MRTSATLLACFIANCILLPLPISAHAGADQPFTITPLVLEGDNVPDLGIVHSVNKVTINNDGVWIVEVIADDGYCSNALLRGGDILLSLCSPLDEPKGSYIHKFRSINVNNKGNSGWEFEIVSNNAYLGVYFNTDLLLLEGDISAAEDFTPGTTYQWIFGTQINSNDPPQILLSAQVDDPNIPGSDDRALVIVTPNADGAGITETVVFKEGDILPGQSEPIILFPNSYSGLYAINDAGDVMFGARITVAPTLRVVYINDFLVAQEGSPSPIKGRNWSHLGPAASVDLNNRGGYVLYGGIYGDSQSNFIIDRNGEKLVQKGDVLPGTNGAPIKPDAILPVLINDLSQVLWMGRWDNPDDDSELRGLLLDLNFLVREGVSTKEGFIFNSLASDNFSQPFAMSDNGRYIIFVAILDDETEGAFMIDFGTPGKCPWDINGDGEVGVLDLLEIINNFGPCDDPENCPWDFNGNGIVNGQDVKELATHFGDCE